MWHREEGPPFKVEIRGSNHIGGITMLERNSHRGAEEARKIPRSSPEPHLSIVE